MPQETVSFYFDGKRREVDSRECPLLFTLLTLLRLKHRTHPDAYRRAYTLIIDYTTYNDLRCELRTQPFLAPYDADVCLFGCYLQTVDPEKMPGTFQLI